MVRRAVALLAVLAVLAGGVLAARAAGWLGGGDPAGPRAGVVRAGGAPGTPRRALALPRRRRAASPGRSTASAWSPTRPARPCASPAPPARPARSARPSAGGCAAGS